MLKKFWRWLMVVALLAGGASVEAQSAATVTSNAQTTKLFAGIHEALDQRVNTLLAEEGRQAASTTPAKDQSALVGSSSQLSPEEGLRDRAGRGRPLTPAMRRFEKLRPLLDPLLQWEGVPSEIAFVVVVESGGRADALSPKGARGLWQLMPETARRYGLVVEGERDERLDVEKSTRAAAQYLRDLYAQFGSWATALAAYNAGEQAVQRAIDRAQSEEFAILASRELLPLETMAYVPAVINLIVSSGNLSGLSGETMQQPRDARIVYAVRRTEGSESVGAYERKGPSSEFEKYLGKKVRMIGEVGKDMIAVNSLTDASQR